MSCLTSITQATTGIKGTGSSLWKLFDEVRGIHIEEGKVLIRNESNCGFVLAHLTLLPFLSISEALQQALGSKNGQQRSCDRFASATKEPADATFSEVSNSIMICWIHSGKNLFLLSKDDY